MPIDFGTHSTSGETQDSRCDHCGLLPFVESLRRTTPLICQSEPMQAVMRRVARFAPSDASVVIHGESGTGKEVVARALHANSPRARKPFVAINVAALPPDLLESELFGHARGAFTGATQQKTGLFEAAHGGTLFLDEIAELPLALQAKLLRALQDGEVRRVGENQSFAVDARILCASHQDLREWVAQGRFRSDLFYRLKVLQLIIPPLRERKADIAPLADAFLRQFGQGEHRFSRSAMDLMQAYDWPGNVRELASAVQHALALAQTPLLQPEDLPEELTALNPEDNPWSLAAVEQAHIQKAIAYCQGNQAEAARLLGIGRNTLWRKLKTMT